MGEKSDKNRSSLVHFEAHFWYLAEIGKYVPYGTTYKSMSFPLLLERYKGIFSPFIKQ